MSGQWATWDDRNESEYQKLQNSPQQIFIYDKFPGIILSSLYLVGTWVLVRESENEKHVIKD